MPSSRLPTPPDVSQTSREMTDDPHGSTRPRLRLFASALQASAASRLHLPPGPGAADGQDVVPPRPLGSVLGDLEHAARCPPSFVRLGRGEHDVRRRSRQHVDVEARLVGAGRRSAPASANRASRRRRCAESRISNRLCCVVGGRRLRGRRRCGCGRCRAPRPCSARRPGSRRARPASSARRALSAAGDPAARAPTQPTPSTPATRRPAASNARAARRVSLKSCIRRECGSGGRRRHAYVP